VPDARPLRLGTFLAPRLRPLYEHAAVAIGQAVDRPVELVDGSDFGRLADGELDAAFLCGLPYVGVRERSDAVAPLVAPVADGEGPVYFSAVVARRGEEAAALEDFAGRRLAVNEPESHSGYNVVLAELAARGIPPGGFADVVATGSHAGSLDAVRGDAADVAAVDSHLLEALRADDGALDRELEVIERLGPSPSQPLAAGPGLDASQRQAISSALAAQLPFAAAPGLSVSWAAVTDADYDPIRAMRAAARERGGF
jgi:phosphonate transport system substrate-binding protein